jgi:hypothetical protein
MDQSLKLPVSVDTVKQSKKRGKLDLGAICLLSPDDLRFALAVYQENPDCHLDVLVAQGSEAAKALTEAWMAVQRQSTRCYPLKHRLGGDAVTREVTLPHPPIGASVTSSKQSIRHGSQALDFKGR